MNVYKGIVVELEERKSVIFCACEATQGSELQILCVSILKTVE